LSVDMADPVALKAMSPRPCLDICVATQSCCYRDVISSGRAALVF